MLLQKMSVNGFHKGDFSFLMVGRGIREAFEDAWQSAMKPDVNEILKSRYCNGGKSKIKAFMNGLTNANLHSGGSANEILMIILGIINHEEGWKEFLYQCSLGKESDFQLYFDTNCWESELALNALHSIDSMYIERRRSLSTTQCRLFNMQCIPLP